MLGFLSVVGPAVLFKLFEESAKVCMQEDSCVIVPIFAYKCAGKKPTFSGQIGFMNAVAPLSSSDRSVVAPAVFSEFLTASLLILRAISRTNSRGIFGSAGRPRFRDFECQNIRKAV